MINKIENWQTVKFGEISSLYDKDWGRIVNPHLIKIKTLVGEDGQWGLFDLAYPENGLDDIKLPPTKEWKDVLRTKCNWADVITSYAKQDGYTYFWVSFVPHGGPTLPSLFLRFCPPPTRTQHTRYDGGDYNRAD